MYTLPFTNGLSVHIVYTRSLAGLLCFTRSFLVIVLPVNQGCYCIVQRNIKEMPVLRFVLSVLGRASQSLDKLPQSSVSRGTNTN